MTTATASRLLDLVERGVILVLYVFLVWRILGGYRAHGGVASLFILPSEGLVLVLLLIRRPATELSRSAGEWLLALAATMAPMLVSTGIGRPLVPPVAAAVLMLMGTLIQLHAKITLGRSFGCVPAHRGLQLGGPYRFVRHPMYAGYLVAHVGFFLVNPTWWNLAAYALCYALQIPRLLLEERLLRRDPAYRDYCQRVRWRLVYGLY